MSLVQSIVAALIDFTNRVVGRVIGEGIADAESRGSHQAERPQLQVAATKQPNPSGSISASIP